MLCCDGRKANNMKEGPEARFLRARGGEHLDRTELGNGEQQERKLNGRVGVRLCGAGAWPSLHKPAKSSAKVHNPGDASGPSP